MKLQAQRLKTAVKCIQAKDIEPYFQLRDWKNHPSKRKDFEKLFKRYYGLNSGGLTDEWKDRYFDHLFSVDVNGLADPYSEILNDLYEYPRRKGDKALQFSFASKLVAIHDESKPLFDRHVSNFFGFSPPAKGSNNFRIAGFLDTMQILQRTYADWLWEQDFIDVLNDFRKRIPELAPCHPHRLLDFLVWAVGHYKVV